MISNQKSIELNHFMGLGVLTWFDQRRTEASISGWMKPVIPTKLGGFSMDLQNHWAILVGKNTPRIVLRRTIIWGCNQQELSWRDWQLLLPFGGPRICVRQGILRRIYPWDLTLKLNIVQSRQVHSGWVGRFWTWMESIDVSNDHDGMWVNGDPTVMDSLM